MSFKWKKKTFDKMDEIIEAALALTGAEQQDFVKAYCESGAYARSNIGYFSGYYDNARRAEICKVFGTSHPIFGTDPVTPDEAFELDKKFGEASKGAGK